MNRTQTLFIQTLRRLLFLGAGFMVAWSAQGQTRGPASDPHPLVQILPRSQAPSVKVHRYFETGGSETLALSCRPERTEESKFACQIQRTRNGFEVALTRVPYERSREWMERFFDGVEKIEREPVSEANPASVHLQQALLGWDIAYNTQNTRGQLLRHQRAGRADVLKWILSLEGKLAAEFYRP